MLSESDVIKMTQKDDNVIIEEIGMANLPLIAYIFHKKYDGKVQFIDIGGDCMIRYGLTNIANMSYLATHLHFLKIFNKTLHLEGNVSIPYVYKNLCSFQVLINGDSVPYEIVDAGLDQEINGEKYECRTAFTLDYVLESKMDYIITFELITDGIVSTCNKINSMRFMPVADIYKNQYKVFDSHVAFIEKNALTIREILPTDIKDYEARFSDSLKEMNTVDADEAIELRKEYYERLKEKKKQVWLFFDRYDKADDNGEVLFEYVCKQNIPNVDAFFIIASDSPDYRRLGSIGKVIPAFSKEHKILLLLADYIFTSQLNGFVENPFGDKCEYYRDLYHNARVIFLQHGVTKDDQSKWLHRYKQNIHAIVTSAIREKEEFQRKEYGLLTKQIWLTGMPRFDRLYHNESQQILVMPTWRKSIMFLRKDCCSPLSKWTANDGFQDSVYVKKYNHLLNSKFLKWVCKCFQYEIACVLHPLSRPYEKMFTIPTWIKRYPSYASYKDIFAESSIMITDYSSVAFDFAYQRKPVIYYQFDSNTFFDSHTYGKGFYDYVKDGFGEVVENEAMLCLILSRYLAGGCKLKDYYKKRIESFFAYTDHKNCDRIMNKIIIEGDKVL